jgi:hypothetical protein
VSKQYDDAGNSTAGHADARTLNEVNLKDGRCGAARKKGKRIERTAWRPAGGHHHGNDLDLLALRWIHDRACAQAKA